MKFKFLTQLKSEEKKHTFNMGRKCWGKNTPENSWKIQTNLVKNWTILNPFINSKLLYNLNSSSYCASWEFMRQCENGNIWWVSEWVTKSIERSNYENICNAFKLSSNTFSVYRKHSHICTIFSPLCTLQNVHFLILSTIINLKIIFPTLHRVFSIHVAQFNQKGPSIKFRK